MSALELVPPDDDDFTPPPPDDATGKPQIRLGIAMVPIIDRAIEALRADLEIFVAAGALKRIIESDGTEAGLIQRAAGAPVVREAHALWLRERLSLAADFVTTKKKGRGEKAVEVDVNIQPPAWLASHIIERGTWPGYRALVGVVRSPTMRADGSLLQTPGYDRSSGLVYAPATEYEPVPDAPTWDDVVAARDRLLDVVDDFPLSDVGRAGWLAMLFTLVARELVTGACPAFALDAPTAGSGKGLAIACAHRIAYGVDAAHMSLPPTEEELRKQITTCLISGDPAILLDNVGVPLGGDSLDAVITAPIWKVRLLGKNEDSGSLIPRAVWLITANGLELVGDMGRRTLRIRLEPSSENPETRTDYKHPERKGADKLLSWVSANRAALVVDALTCLRGWHLGGRLGRTKEWGSFESWCSTVGACVIWLEQPDPSLGRASDDAQLDPAKLALVAVYEAIERLTVKTETKPPRGPTTGELVAAAKPRDYGQPSDFPDLAEALAVLAPRGDDAARSRALGRKLKAGRIIGKRKLLAEPWGGRTVRYRVEQVSP